MRERRLPGYLLRPDATGTARPTLVMTNGSDGSLPEMIANGAAEALTRGWNVCLYDGPGQQSMLFERGVPFRHDWEAVLTPVIDALVARADVDATALTGYGISQAGYWLPRALAFEHRLVAAVADPGVVDVSTSWTGHLPPELIEVLHAGQKDVFNGIMQQVDADPAMARTMAFRSRPYGITDAFDVFTEVEKYQLRDVVGQISTPLLLTDPQDEQFWPGQSRQLYDLLPGVEGDPGVHPGRGREPALPADGPAADPSADVRLAGGSAGRARGLSPGCLPDGAATSRRRYRLSRWPRPDRSPAGRRPTGRPSRTALRELISGCRPPESRWRKRFRRRSAGIGKSS